LASTCKGRSFFVVLLMLTLSEYLTLVVLQVHLLAKRLLRLILCRMNEVWQARNDGYPSQSVRTSLR
jgi:hypothetical protein